MAQIYRHKKFLKDFRNTRLTDEQFTRLARAITCFAKEEPLPQEFLDHSLSGSLGEYREFHLGGDMLVLYKRIEQQIVLARLGTHSQLFGE